MIVIETDGQKKNKSCGLCSEWPFQLWSTSRPNLLFFFSRISCSSKRKKAIKVLNYNVGVWRVVINKLDLKKSCEKKGPVPQILKINYRQDWMFYNRGNKHCYDNSQFYFKTPRSQQSMNIHNIIFAATLGKSFLGSKYRLKLTVKKGGAGKREGKKNGKDNLLKQCEREWKIRPIWGRMKTTRKYSVIKKNICRCKEKEFET